MSDEQQLVQAPGVTEIGEMQWSEDCGELFAAFAVAQANLGPLVATHEVKVQYETKTGKKGEYTYKYAGLPETLQACVAAYAAAGCAIVQPVSTFDNGIGVRTLITHSSGQWWLSPKVFIPVLAGGGAQDLGSAITFGRRYSLQGAVALSPANGDDNGGGAQRSRPSSWVAPRESSRRTEPDRKLEKDPYMTGKLAIKAAATWTRCARIAANKSTDDKLVTPRDVWEAACARCKLPLLPDGSTPKIEQVRKSHAWPICDLIQKWDDKIVGTDTTEQEPGEDLDVDDEQVPPTAGDGEADPPGAP